MLKQSRRHDIEATMYLSNASLLPFSFNYSAQWTVSAGFLVEKYEAPQRS